MQKCAHRDRFNSTRGLEHEHAERRQWCPSDYWFSSETLLGQRFKSAVAKHLFAVRFDFRHYVFVVISVGLSFPKVVRCSFVQIMQIL